MGRSRFPGKPLKFQNRKRISVLSGLIYNESTSERQPLADGATTNVFAEEKEEEEKKEISPDEQVVDNSDCQTSTSSEIPISTQETKNNIELSKSPVRTRSQNKMEPIKGDKPKPVKKTVTFGTVESCEDTFLPLKKLPSKNMAPLVPIIKKKSAIKQSEYSSFNSILKPAKLTDLSSKSSFESSDGYLRKHFNPLSKPINKFSQFSESRCLSPPPRNTSPIDSSTKFVLPVRSAHSSRVIKPNKKFIDEEQTANPSTTSILTTGKLLKKPKLKKVVFNNLHQDDDSPHEDETDKNDSEKLKDKKILTATNIFKEKTSNSFSGLSNSRKTGRDLFSTFEKDPEYHQDENSNLEGLESLKTIDSNKDDRGGHALRKLMDISDASSTSSSTSGSESEESWDSDSPNGSGDEEEGHTPPSPEREKPPTSQLLSGKVIIREARLQLNTPIQSNVGPDGPFSTFTTCSSPNPPTTVTCGVCGAVRFYKFVKQARKFGIYSCESCRKFISKMIKKEKVSQSSGPVVMHCLKREGNCHVPPIVRSQQWKFKRCANKSRCPACWLKMCLKAFQVPTTIRTGLSAMLPPYMRGLSASSPLRIGAAIAPPVFGALVATDTEKQFTSCKITKKTSEENVDKNVEETKVKKEVQTEKKPEEESEEFSLNRKRRLTRVKVRKKEKDESKQVEDPKRQKVELKGPRVKHVCRSASIVLGQPIATFPAQDAKDNDKSLLSDEEGSLSSGKDNVVAEIPSSCDTDKDSENKAPQIVPEILVPKEPIVETKVETKKRKIEATVVPKLLPKPESSEDETVMELVPRKPALKLSVNVSNAGRGRAQKCDQNRPELICVDFWESYDPDEVCSTGFGLIGTAPFTVTRLCFLCGSAGREKMVQCRSCCEWYHAYCGEEAGCARCVWCAACGRGSARAACRACAAPHHAACLPHAHRTDWPQICNACLKCKSCDSTRVTKFVGSLPFCGSCFKLRQKGNYCPLCQACYRDNDFDSKMMECGWCSRWVHASCEGLSGEGYQLLSALPPSIEYICRQCIPHDPPWRKMLTEYLKGRLLHLLKLLAKNKQACALLKLTPHKNTPVPNKTCRLMSTQAIRKLHFEDGDSMTNTTETKVYRNTSRGRRALPPRPDRPDRSDQPAPWPCHDLLPPHDKEDVPHTSHKVVNLQEPLMQNKEICFSAGLYDTKAEFDTPCVEVHENNPPEKKDENNMIPTTVHDDKYEAISDDDEPMKVQEQVRSEQDLSPAIVRFSGDTMDDSNRLLSPSLLDIKKRVNCDEYVSLKDFNHEMKEVIQRTSNVELKKIYKNLFSETFPWFDCENNCLQPNLEVEGENEDTDSLKDQDILENKGSATTTHSNHDRSHDHIVPKVETEGSHLEDELDFFPVPDSRSCVLCKVVGDADPAMEGRLLYCGQNDWIHANCALWSAEVFEEIDGSLQNVHSAISRGKMIKCAACDLKGASVGCCAKNCSETYHYACARKENCAFMDDKRVFCPSHNKDIPKKSLQKDSDFELTRSMYVELDKKKKRYSEINKVQFLLGSLNVQSLGKIVPSVSDFEEFLMPVDFLCTRLFWSTKKPTKIVRYTIKTKLILAEPLPGFDFGVNITVDHSMGTNAIDRMMAEIGAWHESIETGAGTAALMLKREKSPKKFGSKVSLEELAVKQVIDFLLDNVCKQEQDEEEPQNTADLLPPELKDAIFEDLNHDLLDGISMQDIFPKLMSYEDLVAMDLKNEFYGAMSQIDDKSNDKTDSRSTTDFIDELLNARLESGSKELKRSKSEMLLQNHNLKSLTTGRGQQRSSSLTWNNKFDTSLLSSTIKRCKMGRTSTVTGKLSPVQRLPLLENPLDSIKEASVTEKKDKPETPASSALCDEAPHTSGLNYRTTSPKEKDAEAGDDKSNKTEGYYTDVIDFYTKIQCSPISQLDGAGDWSGSDSEGSSRAASPMCRISQLDGADDPADARPHYVYRAGAESTYTVTIGPSDMLVRPLDDDQPVRCDRCQCTYRNKDSYDRHVPSCDMMSTSESESENPKSPENRTLATLQNAFQGAFAQPMIIHAGVVSGSENTVKAEGISARRTSINTRQITINGTIVETPSPGPSNEMTMTITEQMKTGTVIFDQGKTTNVQVSANQQMMSSPQIVVTPQMLLPPKTPTSCGQKMMAPQIITQQGMLPYNICVKPGNSNSSIQQLQGNDMTQLLAGAGGIQVLTSNSNQVLTIPNQQSIIQGKSQIANFPNMASASSIALPVNSIQGMPNSSIIQNIQPMIRPNIQGNTIVVPAMTAQRLASPQNKQQIIMSGTPQKSPKKHPAPVQPKPIFQAASRGRGRPIPKPTTIKRQTKLEKTFATINQPLGAGNTVIQLHTNNQSGQPSIIVQPVANQNIMSAYVEALSQQQNQNMQYIATIAPQNDFKTGPTQYISQSGLMPQTFQIQQTESGGLVAVPSGGIPVLLPQGNVGILPQALQQGILPQGTIQQGIISQGPNGPTILPQAIHTQNGATIIPQGTLQGLTSGNLSSQATLLPNNTLQTGGATVVPHSGINNTQTILPNALNSQGNTLISSTPGATLLPQGTLLPQFCNDQVLLGTTPTLEMVTDSSGCMYLTTQPVYYGLETIVQNTVMSSQQFVSTAMQGVLAQNSSFSQTTQVFQASKIEPIVEVPTGYVVVNNVGDTQTSVPNVVSSHNIQTSPQALKNVKTPVPNLTLQPLPDKQTTNINRQTPKVIQMGQAPLTMGSQSGTIITGRANVNPITSQIHSMTLTSASQNALRNSLSKANVSMTPTVTLISSTGQPLMAISQSVSNSVPSFTMQSIPLSQPIVSSSIASSSINKNAKIENSHMIEISGNFQDNLSSNSMPTINVTQSLKSPTPWRQISTLNNLNNVVDNKNVEMHGANVKTSCAMNITSLNVQNNRHNLHNEGDKHNQNSLTPLTINSINTSMSSSNSHVHQMESSHNVSHHSTAHNSSNNMIQITAGNIYTPSSSTMSANFDAETAIKLSKINALSKTEGGHLNFSQEIMASHSQQHAQNEKTFQNIGNSDSKHMDIINNQMNIHKLNSCQMAGNSQPAMNITPHNLMRQTSQNNSINMQNNQNPMSSISSQNNSSHGSQMQNIGGNMTCQEISNNRINITVSSDNNLQQSAACSNAQHELNMPTTSNVSHTSVQMMSHENSHHSSNQIHIMSGQVQHNRQMENNSQIQQPTMMPPGSSNRSFHDNVVSVQQGHNQQVNMPSNRATSESANLMNQSINIHNLNNSHNLNRPQNEMSHNMHIQQSIPNMNNAQNNRMVMENMQSHTINNMGHQMHQNRSMDNIHNTIAQHGVSQMNHHINNSNRQQGDGNVHVNQQMQMQSNRQQVDNVTHHHQQHQMSNVMQLQNNRQHLDNNMMGIHQHMSNQIHNRQIENSMHMHHMPGNNQNMSMNTLDNTGPMTNNMQQSIHNRHDNNSLQMQNMNSINQMQNNRNQMDHPPLLQHQINNMSSINNMNMHNNLHSTMQMNNSGHQPMLHVPSIPDIKNDMQPSCSGSCANNSSQFTNNQSFDMCASANSSMSLQSGNMMHNMNNNMMMNSVNNSGMYGTSGQAGMSGHDMLMSCANTSEHNVNNVMPSNANQMMMNNSQTHANNHNNQMLAQQVSNNAQININNCSINANHTASHMNNIEPQINRGGMNVDQSKFMPEPCRGKNIITQQSNSNLGPMPSITNSDCAKANMVGSEKQTHMSVTNQMAYIPINNQNNRVINLPERGRINNTNMENNIPQHMPQQHNIRVVTNNSGNVGGITPDPMNFQQKSDNSGTMINVPFQAIPNSAPMNINVNSSNNTVNITVQNNLVDPKIASKASTDLNFPIQANTSILPNQSNSNNNMICIPVQNSTINLQTQQNSSSITLPKAPPTQQSGIPTNVVNPMSMRPMNRVLPLHRDGQSKSSTKTSTSTKSAPVPKPRTVSQDMPDLNMKDESIDSDLEKAIEESKRMMALERVKRDKQERDALMASQLPTQVNQTNMSTAQVMQVETSVIEPMVIDTPAKMPSLPTLDADMLEVETPKVLAEKDKNKLLPPTKTPAVSKVMKRPLIDKKSDNETVVTKKQGKIAKGQENVIKAASTLKSTPDPPKDDGPKLIYEVSSEDGFNYSSTSLTDLWAKVVDAVQNARKSVGLAPIGYNLPTTLSGAHLLGLNNNGLRYLVEQLPGASRCTKYKIRQGRVLNSWDNDLDLSEGFKESPWGSARIGPVARKHSHDMFSWMASPYREEPPPFGGQESESSISRRLATLPLAMRFRNLKETSKVSVGVYRSHIHGRGLFCKRDIEEGDMVIEYAGEVIRAVLADQREKRYEGVRGRRGVAGCYMFRIDDHLVVDATLKGNAARFINHSCDPNCYSRVVDIHGHKHILIFALRRITVGEELTYDYKFPFEEVKIPCTCGAKKCRKYLN